MANEEDVAALEMAELKARLYAHPDNVIYLRKFFGGAHQAPELGAGRHLTVELLYALVELARRISAAGKDSTGIQAKRIVQIQEHMNGPS